MLMTSDVVTDCMGNIMLRFEMRSMKPFIVAAAAMTSSSHEGALFPRQRFSGRKSAFFAILPTKISFEVC